jgi:hypothetical protein
VLTDQGTSILVHACQARFWIEESGAFPTVYQNAESERRPTVMTRMAKLKVLATAAGPEVKADDPPDTEAKGVKFPPPTGNVVNDS